AGLAVARLRGGQRQRPVPVRAGAELRPAATIARPARAAAARPDAHADAGSHWPAVAAAGDDFADRGGADGPAADVVAPAGLALGRPADVGGAGELRPRPARPGRARPVDGGGHGADRDV